MITNFETFRELSPDKKQNDPKIVLKTHNTANFNSLASRVSQNSTSTYSNEIILENIQSIKSLGFNVIETYQQLIPVPFTVKSKNNGILPENYNHPSFSFRAGPQSDQTNSQSNQSLKIDQHPYSQGIALSKYSSSTELMYRTSSLATSSSSASFNNKNITFGSGSFNRLAVKKLNIKNLPMNGKDNEETEELGRITERSKESTEFDKLNTDRSNRVKAFEKSLKALKTKQLLEETQGVLQRNSAVENHSQDEFTVFKKNSVYVEKELKSKTLVNEAKQDELKHFESQEQKDRLELLTQETLKKLDSDSTRIGNQFSSRMSFKSLDPKMKSEAISKFKKEMAQNTGLTFTSYGDTAERLEDIETLEVEDLESERSKNFLPAPLGYSKNAVRFNQKRKSSNSQLYDMNYYSGSSVDTYAISRYQGYDSETSASSDMNLHHMNSRKQSNFTIQETISNIYGSGSAAPQFRLAQQGPFESQFTSHSSSKGQLSVRDMLQAMKKEFDSCQNISKDSYRRTKSKLVKNINEENKLLQSQIVSYLPFYFHSLTLIQEKFQKRIKMLQRHLKSKKKSLRSRKNQIFKKREVFTQLETDNDHLQNKNVSNHL